MTPAALQPIDMLAIGATFVLVLSVGVILALILLHKKSSESTKLRQRLGTQPKHAEEGTRVVRLFHEGKEYEAMLPGQGAALFRSPLKSVEAICRSAGINAPIGTILLVAAGIAVLTFAGLWVFTSHTPGSIMAAGAVVFALWTFIKMRATKAEAKFDDQFVEALGLCARSLRAGHTITSGLSLAAEESPEPVKTIFSEIVQQQQFGVSLEDSLRQVSAAHPSADLRLFSASVAIQVRAGGNLAETTNRLASVIRDRIRLGRRMRVLTAQTQTSKRVLLALPAIVFAGLNLINPEYMRPMYQTSVGQMMLMIAAGSLFVGSWVMNKMSVLKY